MIIKGTPASPGIFTGKAYTAKYEPEDIDNITDETVLVGKSFWIDDDLLLYKARAVVTETGGMLCHAAIVARELGKPCVVGINDLLSIVSAGDTIIVDGTNGQITIEKNNLQRGMLENPGYIDFIDNMKPEPYKNITVYTEKYNGKLYLYFPKTDQKTKDAALQHFKKQYSVMQVLEAEPKPPAVVIEKYSYFKIHLENMQNNEYAQDYNESINIAEKMDTRKIESFANTVYQKAFKHLEKCLEHDDNRNKKQAHEHMNLFTGYFEQISKVNLARKTFEQLKKQFADAHELENFLVKADHGKPVPGKQHELEVYALVKKLLNKKRDEIIFNNKSLKQLQDHAWKREIYFG
ncbi:MAG: hypothetical protein J4432_01820 [DPANN group archaeon]|nr:hypothetical protein [DPANN group archaeon]